jgi:hypothetical protein
VINRRVSEQVADFLSMRPSGQREFVKVVEEIEADEMETEVTKSAKTDEEDE